MIVRGKRSKEDYILDNLAIESRAATLMVTSAAVKDIDGRPTKKNGQYTLDQSFVEVSSNVKTQLNKLKKFKRIFQNRTDISEELKNTVIKDLDAKITLLDKAVILVQNKAAHRDSQQKMFADTKASGLASSISEVMSEEDFNKINEESKKSDNRLSYLEAFWYKYVKEASKELKARLRLALKNSYISHIEQMSKLSQIELSSSTMKVYAKNPTGQRLVSLIKYMLTINGVNKEVQSLTNFEEHFDFFFFKSQLEATNYSEFDNPDKVRELISEFTRLHTIINTIHSMRAEMSSTFKLEKHVDRQVDSANKGNKRPTLQQNYVIRRLMSRIMTPFKKVTDANKFKNTFFIQGFIGTGKTALVISDVFNSLINQGVKSDEIILSGHSSRTAKRLNSDLKSESDTLLLDNITAKSLEGSKYLVIDEGAALDNKRLNDIIDITNDLGIKVILVGDLTQNKVEPLPEAAVNEHMNHFDTLSVIYRSAIPAVSSAGLSYKGKTQVVQEVNLTSNTEARDVANNNKNLLGAVKATKDQILDALSKESPNKRILIVNSAAEVAEYSRKVHPSVEVLDYIQVQGTEEREAYVIIEQGLNHAEYKRPLTTKEFNSAMYTSLGRATHFTMFYDPGVVTENTVSKEIENKTEDLQKDFAKIRVAHKESLAVSAEVLNMEVNIESTPVKPEDSAKEPSEETTKDEEQMEEVDESSPGTQVPEQPQPDIEESQEDPNVVVPDTETLKAHRLHTPANHFLKKGFEEVDLSRLYVVKNDFNGDLLMVAKHKDNNVGYVMSILTTQEIEENPELNPIIQEAPSINIAASYRTPFNLGNNALLEAHSVQVLGSNRLTIVNGETKSLSIGDTLEKFFTSFVEKARGTHNIELVTKLYNDDGSLNWKELSKTAKIVIFSSLEAKDGYSIEEFSRKYPNGFTPLAGMPMLVIEGLQMKTAKGGVSKAMAPIMIPLEVNKYSEDTAPEYAKSYVKLLNDVHSSLDFLTTKLYSITDAYNFNLNQGKRGTTGKVENSKLNDMIENFAKLFFEVQGEDIVRTSVSANSFFKDELDLEDESDIADLEKQFNYLIPLLYGISKVRKVVELKDLPSNSQFIAVKKKDRDKEKDKLSPNTKVYVTYKDSDDKIKFEYSDVLQRNLGPAQRALNALSSANKNAPFATQVNKYSADGTKGKSYTTGKKILSNTRVTGTQYGKLRSLWTKGTETARSLVSIIPGIVQAIENNDWLPEDYIQDNGRPLNIKFKPGIKSKFYDSGNPQALILLVEEVENLLKEDKPYFNQFFQSKAEGLNWVATTKATFEEIMQESYQKGMSLKDLGEIANNSGNLNTPLFRTNVPMHGSDNAINSLGTNLSEADNRNKLESMLKTKFEGITPTSITVGLPKKESPIVAPEATQIVPTSDIEKLKAKLEIENDQELADYSVVAGLDLNNPQEVAEHLVMLDNMSNNNTGNSEVFNCKKS